MEKVLSTVSVVGGIILAFLGIGMMLMEGATEEKSELMETILMTLLFFTGGVTMLYVIKSNSGKGKTE